ncbi:hypothetical protein D0862_03145 [Hortaea werneckii]|uniref:Uncharacterized protein n=1 Tax=Hortaea werneckii TaxID=91943 RepID=A0A3M7HBW4_HORWE|nr:hypothetical protein D0862_03145 [Hortaea werneckii]
MGGILTIERCERFCDFCTSEADRKHRWKFAWFLRRHVEAVHIKGGEYPGLLLADTWTRPDGAAARQVEKQPKKKPPPRKSKGKSKAQQAVSETPEPEVASESESSNIAVGPVQGQTAFGHHSRSNSHGSEASQAMTVTSSLSDFSSDLQVGGLYSSPQQQTVDMSSSPPQPVPSTGYDFNNFGLKNVVNNFDISPVKGPIYSLPTFNGNDNAAGAYTLPDPFAAGNGNDMMLGPMDFSSNINNVNTNTNNFNGLDGHFSDPILPMPGTGGIEAPTTTSPTPTTPKRVRRGREPNTPEKRQVVQDVRGTFGSIVRYLREGDLDHEEIQNVVDGFSDEFFGY